jgi:hypothetical protein
MKVPPLPTNPLDYNGDFALMFAAFFPRIWKLLTLIEEEEGCHAGLAVQDMFRYLGPGETTSTMVDLLTAVEGQLVKISDADLYDYATSQDNEWRCKFIGDHQFLPEFEEILQRVL